jgi:hypothetical protein
MDAKMIFKMKINYFLKMAMLPVLLLLGSCEKFLDVQPPAGTFEADDIFMSTTSATAAISTLYIQLVGYPTFEATTSLGLYADELENAADNSTQRPYVESMVPVLDSRNNLFWAAFYANIFRANYALEGLSKSTALTKDLNDQLTGEALFIRAFAYNYLVNLYGDVPLVTTTDYITNALLPKESAGVVTEQIVTDLERARTLLKPEYPITEKVRANKWAATALLARVYLYQKKWDKAAQMAGEVIASARYTLPAPGNVFLKGSSEAILQIPQTTVAQYSREAFNFIPSSTTVIPSYPLTSSLASSFETGDRRLTDWTGSNLVGTRKYYYPAKYKQASGAPSLEYYVLMRAAEQYLIRAEASAQLNALPQAIADLDVVRARAGLPLIRNTQPTISQPDLLAVIEHENRIEFFTEMGHRWFDLRRAGNADKVLKTLKPATWNIRGSLWPVPQVQLDGNPNLKQNPDYL